MSIVVVMIYRRAKEQCCELQETRGDLKEQIYRVGLKQPSRPPPHLIKVWKEKLRTLEQGTPQWKAYRQRLIEVGEIKP